jgi:hypothetical protein
VQRPRASERCRAALDTREPNHPAATAALMASLWADGEFTRRSENIMQAAARA